MTAVVVGIDPGKAGAIAALDATDGGLMWVADMPVANDEVSPVLFALTLARVLDDRIGRHDDVTVVVEEVAAFPKNGSIGNFKLGQAHGIILGAVGAMRLPLHRVRPAVWKKAMKLSSDKELSRARALDLWPEHAPDFRFKKHADRAEAALIARWWLEHRPEMVVEK